MNILSTISPSIDDSEEQDSDVYNEDNIVLPFSSQVERVMYILAILLGLFAFTYTVIKLSRLGRREMIFAARLFEYKISLTVADFLILFVYAPTQVIWFSTIWFYGDDFLCKFLKFITTFSFHLTANIQVLVAFDRLLITAKMNQVSRNSRKYHYNTRICLSIAWVLALFCALPQIFIFRIGTTPGGHPQCITKWVEFDTAYRQQMHYIRSYEEFQRQYSARSPSLFHPNGSFAFSSLPSAPPVSESSLNSTLSQLVFLEHLYNTFHLLTICVLPYLLELFCYSVIIYILNVASRGKFLTVRDVIRKFLCCGRSSSASLAEKGRESSSSHHPPVNSRISGSTEWKNQSFLLHSAKRVQLKEEESRPRSASFDSTLPRVLPTSVSLQNELSQAVYTLPTPTPTSQQNGQQNEAQEVVKKPSFLLRYIAGRVFHLPDERVPLRSRPRHASCIPPTDSSLPTQLSPRPKWLSTVETARRSARRKAILMLGLNLLFWAPYCIHSTIIQFTDFTNYDRFQFVLALVTFNAISNILL